MQIRILFAVIVNFCVLNVVAEWTGMDAVDPVQNMGEAASCYRSLKHIPPAELGVGNAGDTLLTTPKESAKYQLFQQSVGELPATFDWRDVNGTNFCTVDINQHVPHYCGGCWAIASTSALADRIKIMRQGRFPELYLASQTLLSCVPLGCAGGDPDFAYLYIRVNGIGPSSCRGFTAQGNGFVNCSAMDRCMNCDMNGTCYAISDFPKFGIEENGDVLGVDQMKREIFARGPIVCGVDAGPLFSWGFGPHRREVFSGGVNHTNVDHVVSVVGWGFDQTSNSSYWVARNSWGSYWGDFGYFKLKLGENQLGMEGTPCSWATPTYPPDLGKL